VGAGCDVCFAWGWRNNHFAVLPRFCAWWS